MKYLKLFETEAEYTQFKDSEDYITPNVSYIVENSGVAFNPYATPASPNLVCTYNVTDISQETSILHSYGLPYMTNMIVDGVEMEAETYYQFDTVGNHVVEFVLDDPTTMGETPFYCCTGLTSITIPDSVTSINWYAFYGCTGLSEITCNAITAPTIDNYAFQNVKSDGVLKVPAGSDYSSWMSTDAFCLGYYN